MSDSLIVFAKVPVPGGVKTRLTSLLTDEEAAALYEALLYDALEQYAELPVDVRLYLDHYNDGFAPGPFDGEVFVQREAALGERMARAFAETFAAGYERAVIIGTDHPTLPPQFIEQAFQALDRPGTVSIGPARDGGYYLLGMSDLLPALFQDMSYSHEQVFEQTLESARRVAHRLTILPEWYDVDTPEDLKRLASELCGHPRSTVRRSYDAVKGLMKSYPHFFDAIPYE